MSSIAQRAEELRRLIDHHTHKYYVDAQPEISDRDYDLRRFHSNAMEWD